MEETREAKRALPRVVQVARLIRGLKPEEREQYPGIRGFRKIRSEARPRAVGAPEDGRWEQFSDTLLSDLLRLPRGARGLAS